MKSEQLVPLEALSGLESAVVQALLQLAPATRDALVREYSRRHGTAAAAWLSRAVELWPSQPRFGVSRVTLARLFALLPEHLDEPQRLQLAEAIWGAARAPSSATLKVPPGFRNHAVLRALVHEHFLGALPSVVEMPEALQASVPWLNDPALQAQYQVLNLLLLAERDAFLSLMNEQIEVLFARRLDGMEIRCNFSIAGHELLLRTDPSADRPVLERQNAEYLHVARHFDYRASQSALLGAAIGAALALLVWALVSVL